MGGTKQKSSLDVGATRRRLHLIFLFCCAVFLFILILLWQALGETSGIYASLANLLSKSEQVPARSVSANSIQTNTITYDKISPQAWERAANTLASLVLNKQATNSYLGGLYVSPNDMPDKGDISGTFESGLSIDADAVVLGTDTTGDYVSSVIGGAGLSGAANGEGAQVVLDVKAGAGISVDATGVSINTVSGGGLIVGSGGLLLLNTCSDGQLLKWQSASSLWACAADVDTDTNTTYSAGSGLSLAGTIFSLDSSLAMFKTIDASLGTDPVADSLIDTLALSSGDGIDVTGDSSTDTVSFSLNLATSSGLAISGTALTLLNTCSNGQYLAWTSGSSSWGCASIGVAPNVFQTIAGDSGSAVADAASDTVTIVGGNGLTSTGSDVADTVTFNVDLASGSGLTFSSGALTLLACSDGQILKHVAGSWACATDADTMPANAYKQQLTGTDNVAVGSSLTPLLTNGSGTAQSLGITITSGNEVSLAATIEVSSSLVTGPVTYVVIRDDNHDNDCVTGGGDGTQIGGQATSFLASIAQSFTTTITFADSSPAATTSYYQLCASTTIGTGTTTVTDRALTLNEINL